jgi:aspartate aminotransferase/aminotransferase
MATNSTNIESMLSKRVRSVDSSGIRRVFDLAASLDSPINLSIGQPDFDASPEVLERAHQALEQGRSGYTLTQGIPELRESIRNRHNISADDDLDVFVTAGVSGGLLLSYMTLLDPGDEILMPDPFFCIYRDLALMLNAVPTYYDTYPNFSLSAEKIEEMITPKTKAILVNSPGNPTGYAVSQSELDEVIELAKRKNIFLIYDEIYDSFVYDDLHAKCDQSYERTILLNGFSKWAGVPGWRVAYVIAPKALVSHMLKLQQYTLVCANSVSQWALVAASSVDFKPCLEEYRKKRDFLVEGLRGHYNFVVPGGAFYLFAEAPGGCGQSFVERAVSENLLVVPGHVFSQRDTHFRISFSAPMEVLERGVEVLQRLAS